MADDEPAGGWSEEIWAQVHHIAGAPDTRPDWLRGPRLT